MDTVYYHLNARKVKVSGGSDLVTFVPVSAPVPQEGPKGQVLDFARCCRRLETKTAWKELSAVAEEASWTEEEPEMTAPRPRRERAAGWLELLASAAVIAVSVAAVIAFLSVA